MVSFQCHACGDVVKKPKLDQHRGRCNAGFDCIDCHTTFNTPSDYKGHTSCITEAEKYEKSLYKGPKLNGHGASRGHDQGRSRGSFQRGRGTTFRPSHDGRFATGRNYIRKEATGANDTPLGPSKMSPVTPSPVSEPAAREAPTAEGKDKDKKRKPIPVDASAGRVEDSVESPRKKAKFANVVEETEENKKRFDSSKDNASPGGLDKDRKRKKKEQKSVVVTEEHGRDVAASTKEDKKKRKKEKIALSPGADSKRKDANIKENEEVDSSRKSFVFDEGSGEGAESSKKEKKKRPKSIVDTKGVTSIVEMDTHDTREKRKKHKSLPVTEPAVSITREAEKEKKKRDMIALPEGDTTAAEDGRGGKKKKSHTDAAVAREAQSAADSDAPEGQRKEKRKKEKRG